MMARGSQTSVERGFNEAGLVNSTGFMYLPHHVGQLTSRAVQFNARILVEAEALFDILYSLSLDASTRHRQTLVAQPPVKTSFEGTTQHAPPRPCHTSMACHNK